MIKNLKIGFSTCPNDTFVFDALVNHKIDTGGFTFDVYLADVQELNIMAEKGQLDIIKVSYAHLPAILSDYIALTSGGAMGYNCGPLLVARKAWRFDDFSEAGFAIPGENTTANKLLTHFFPKAARKSAMLFSEIEDAVVDGIADIGLIIHESRFTYRDKGLIEIADLGEMWHQKTQMPIPLGAIAISKKLPPEVLINIDKLVKESVMHAMANPEQTMDYVKKHSVSLSDEVIFQHINLYVNDFSLDAGIVGKEAVRLLLKAEIGDDESLFVDEFLKS